MENKYLTPEESAIIDRAGQLIDQAEAAKQEPAKCRLLLTELQAIRFTIGNYFAERKAEARFNYSVVFNALVTAGKSDSAADKAANANEGVVNSKNARDILEVSYNTISDFVSIHQTSLRVATEEVKNNL